MSNKVVINKCYGGFSLSFVAALHLANAGVQSALEHCAKDYPTNYYTNYYPEDLARHDPRLIAVVEQLGERAWGESALLEIVELRGRTYRIEEDSGKERAIEPDASWTVIP